MYKKSLLFAIVVHIEIADLQNECELVAEIFVVSPVKSEAFSFPIALEVL
jgi:hypothetical protein